MSIEFVAAVDWSGKSRGAEEFIWIAEVRGGELVGLRNGVTRVGVPAAVEGADVVGLDFAFSFPAWYCGGRSVEQVWQEMADHGHDLLASEPDPFWGRTKPRGPERQLRSTDERGGAKSVFQIGGAGAVGTGSVRGMPVLLALRAAGFAIWPFHAGMPRVIDWEHREELAALEPCDTVEGEIWSPLRPVLGAARPGNP